MYCMTLKRLLPACALIASLVCASVAVAQTAFVVRDMRVEGLDRVGHAYGAAVVRSGEGHLPEDL